MSIKKVLLISISVACSALLLNGCGTSNYELTQAGKNVQFVDTIPGDNCKLLGKAEGRRGTFFSGTKTGSELMRDAAKDLLNKAGAMGGNVVYNAQDATTKYISDVAPTDMIMVGDVYHCTAQ